MAGHAQAYTMYSITYVHKQLILQHANHASILVNNATYVRMYTSSNANTYSHIYASKISQQKNKATRVIICYTCILPESSAVHMAIMRGIIHLYALYIH